VSKGAATYAQLNDKDFCGFQQITIHSASLRSRHIRDTRETLDMAGCLVVRLLGLALRSAGRVVRLRKIESESA
jgi:hypothetical protein